MTIFGGSIFVTISGGPLGWQIFGVHFCDFFGVHFRDQFWGPFL